MSTPTTRPADRYGDRRPRRWLKLAGAIAAVVMAIAAVLFIARAMEAQIAADALSWRKSDDDTMTATIEVVRRPDTVVTCDVVAVDLRQIIVGQTELVVPASSARRSVVEVTIPLQGDGVAVSVRGCEPQNGR